MTTITDVEWDRLWQDDPFETTRLLRVADNVPWTNSRPSLELRAGLLKIHQSALLELYPESLSCEDSAG